MTSDEWLATLSEFATQDRDDAIAQAINDGTLGCTWVTIVLVHPKDSLIQAQVDVCDDALFVTLGDGTRFRPPVSANLAQRCADLLEASMPTSKLMDESYIQSTKLPVTIIPASKAMTTLSDSKIFNKSVESKRKEQSGLIRDVGKAWILSNTLVKSGFGCNYGFYDPHAPRKSAQGCALWQTRGDEHANTYTDYSQTLYLVKSKMIVNGSEMNVADVLLSEELHELVSDEGIIKFSKQP